MRDRIQENAQRCADAFIRNVNGSHDAIEQEIAKAEATLLRRQHQSATRPYTEGQKASDKAYARALADFIDKEANDA